MTSKSIPKLSSNPLSVTEVVGADDRLSAPEREYLDEREKIIERGGQTFVEVGTALAEIRDYQGGALYKKRYGSFEAYCKERWDFGPAYGYRLITAAEIVHKLSPRGDTKEKAVLPTSEKQVRELVRLESPAQQRKAWKETVEKAGENPIRASDVRKAVQGVMKDAGIKPKPAKRKKMPESYRIEASDLKEIRSLLKTLEGRISKLTGGEKREPLIAKIEKLLPGIA